MQKKTDSRLRVLFIVPDAVTPATKGYQVRCQQIASGLSSRYHTRVFAARRSATTESLNADARPFARVRSLVARVFDGMPLQSALFDGDDVAREATAVVESWQPDAVVIVTERLPITAIALQGHRVLIDVVDSMRLHMAERARRSGWLARVLWNREASAFRNLAPQLRRAAAAVIVSSDSALVDYPDAIVIRNAAPASPKPRPDPTIDVVFTGTLSYWPNFQAALDVCRNIAPRIRVALPGSKIVVAGKAPSQELRRACAAAGVELYSDVPDMDAVLRQSRLALAPLPWTPAGNLKVLEALAAGTPVLAYPTAVAHLPLTAGIRVCETAEAMALEATAILEGRHDLSVDNRNAQTWAARASDLERALDRVIAESPELPRVGPSVSPRAPGATT